MKRISLVGGPLTCPGFNTQHRARVAPDALICWNAGGSRGLLICQYLERTFESRRSKYIGPISSVFSGQCGACSQRTTLPGSAPRTTKTSTGRLCVSARLEVSPRISFHP